MASRALLTLALCATLPLAGCSAFRSYDSELTATSQHLATGNVGEALTLLEKNNKAQQRFDQLWTTQDDDLLKQMDPNDTWFSLKDVMELILMQTKQMQLQQMDHECVFCFIVVF